MPSERLVEAIKNIVGLAKAGKRDEAYEGYRALFSDPEFSTYRPEDQRRALRLMIDAKLRMNFPGPAIVEAHRAAIGPLSELAGMYGEPGDFEALGLCQVMVGDEPGAAASFRVGLNIERSRNPQSDLCGKLMKWVASV